MGLFGKKKERHEMPDLSPRTPKENKGNKPFRISISILILVSLWIMSGVFFGDKDQGSEKQQQSYDLPKVQVDASRARIKQEIVTVYGATEPSKTVNLIAEVEGRVTSLIVKEGDELKKDQSILTIDDRDRLERVNEARARVKQREVESKAATALSSKGFQAATRAAEAKADLEGAKAQLAKAQLDFANTSIKAPFDGIIEEISVEVGDLVGQGFSNTVVGEFVSNDPLKAVGFLSEKDVLKISVGDPVKAKTITKEEYAGIVTFVSKVADPTTRTFRVEADIKNEGSKIPAGVTVEMQIAAGERSSHLVPASALSLDSEGELGVKLFQPNRGDLKTANKQPGQGLVSFFRIIDAEDEGEGLWVYGLPDSVLLITLGQAFVDAGDIVIATDANGNPIGGAGGRNN